MGSEVTSLESEDSVQGQEISVGWRTSATRNREFPVPD